MTVLDTTVLVHAKGADHPLRDPCRRLIKAVGDGVLDATTSVEVIQEFTHVRARRHGRVDATALARDLAQLLTPLMVIDGEHLDQGLTLFEAVEGIGAFDAVLAAAAMGAQDACLVSADRGFSRVPGLLHVVPDAAGVEGLLSG